MAEAIYTDSAHQHVIGQYYKRLLTFSAPVEQMVKRVSYSFWRDQLEFESAFWLAFFLSFQIS